MAPSHHALPVSKKQHRSDVQLSERLASLSNHGGQLRAPVHHSTMVFRGLRGILNWAPSMSKDASLSDTECEFFHWEFLQRSGVCTRGFSAFRHHLQMKLIPPPPKISCISRLHDTEEFQGAVNRGPIIEPFGQARIKVPPWSLTQPGVKEKEK